MSTLTNDQKIKITNFKQLFTDLNDDECRRILQSNAWNPNASAEFVLRSRIPRPTRFEEPTVFNGGRKKRKFTDIVRQEVNVAMSRDVICYAPVISMDAHPWLYTLVHWVSMPVTVAAGIFNLFLKHIFFWRSRMIDRAKLELQEVQLMEQLSSCYMRPRINQPETAPGVTLFLGTFEEALNQAKYEHKLLMVYLHRLGHKDSEIFLNSSLLHEDVVKLLNDPENILIWVGYLSPNNSIESDPNNQNVRTASEQSEIEGFEMSQLLKMNYQPITSPIFTNQISSFLFKKPESPFLLAMLAYSSNIIIGRRQFNIIGQLERPLEPKELINLLNGWIEIGNRPRLKIKREKESRDAIQNLRREQDVAFTETLAYDKKKQALKQSELDRQNALSIKKEDLRVKLTQMMEHTITLAAESQNSLPDEPQGENLPETKVYRIVTVMIRMHNGRRFPWTFPVKNSVKYLYYVIYSQFDAPCQFELLWGYPQRSLGCCPINLDNNEIHLDIDEESDKPSFSDLGMKENQIILVRDLEA